MISSDERSLIRSLAGEAAAIAGDEPRMSAIKRRWRDVNELRRPDRAPVWCKPVGCWDELLPESALRCESPKMRALEREFRQVLIKRDIDDDTPVEPWYEVPAVIESTPSNLWGIEPNRHKPATDGGAWSYDPTVKSLDDLERLAMPEFRIDQQATAARMAFHEELFGDILPVKVALRPSFGHVTFGTRVCEFLGMTEMMMLMMTEPELVHRITAHFRDAELRLLDAMEASGLLSRNNTAPMECSDSFGPDSADGRVSLSNLWASGNSQEYDQVSPEMWKEFCLEYQKPVFARFGRVIYGCCENLTKKIDGVLSIPNLRVFVCSAWSDFDTVLERVGREHCIMWRQKATDVVCPDDLSSLKGRMEASMRKLQGCPYQVVLRELQTLNGRPRRLHEWTSIAKSLAGRYA